MIYPKPPTTMDREDTELLAHTLAARACICDIELLAVARTVVEMLEHQRWLLDGAALESVLLRDARSAIAKATGDTQ